MDKVIDNNGYLLVCVPEGSGDFEISMSHYLNYCGYKGEGESIALPKGNYQIVGLAKEVVDAFNVLNKTMTDRMGMTLEEFLSLVKSHSMELNTCLILKKF